jgi:hypothetical protein
VPHVFPVMQALQYGIAYGADYAQHFRAIAISGIWTGNNP